MASDPQKRCLLAIVPEICATPNVYVGIVLPGLNMRIVVLGATGMLGHKLVQRLSRHNEVHATVRNEKSSELLRRAVADDISILDGIEAENFDSILNVIERIEPDAILNCIGIVKQSPESQDPVKSIKINSLFPQQLAEYCSNKGIRLVCYSTDCVFSGMKGKYTQDDIPDPVDIYGRSKLLGEVDRRGCITIRSSIIGRELSMKRGLVEWLIAQTGKNVLGYRNAIFSGFSTLEMANITSLLLNEHKELNGIWQVASPPITKYDLLCLIREVAGLVIGIEPDDRFKCDRSLDGSRFEKATGYIAPDWQRMVRSMVEEMENCHCYG